MPHWTTRSFWETPRSSSFDLDAGALDHLAPARQVLADRRAELFRRVADRLHAQAREALPDLRRGERLHCGRMQLGDGVGRHAGGPDQAGEIIDLEIAQAGFGERRDRKSTRLNSS